MKNCVGKYEDVQSFSSDRFNGPCDTTAHIVNSKKASKLNISKRQIFLALAKLVPEGNKDGGKLIENPNINPIFGFFTNGKATILAKAKR